MEGIKLKHKKLSQKMMMCFFFITLCVIYKILLDFVYVYYLSPNYGYMGFTTNYSLIKSLISILMLIISSLLVPLTIMNYSHIAYGILYIFTYIPLLTYYTVKNEDSEFIIYVTLSFVLLGFLVRCLPRIRLAKVPFSYKILKLFILFFTLFSYLYLLVKIGFNFKFVSIFDVYEVRSAYSEKSNRIVSYLINWQGNVINPFLFALFLNKKKYLGVLLSVFLQLLLYMQTGFKTLFFSYLFILCLYLLIRNRRMIYIVLGPIIIVLLGAILQAINGFIWISALFTNRVLLLPSQLMYQYYHFFSDRGYLFLSNSILKAFIDYPYSLSPANLIGYYFYGNPRTYANVAFLGDAFMQFGFIGIIIFVLMLSVVLIFLDSLAKGKNKFLVISVISMPLFSLTNAALLTTMLTHGLALALFIIYLLPKEKQIN
jgi:hypothetical protein